MGLKITSKSRLVRSVARLEHSWTNYRFNYDVLEVNSVIRTQIKWSKYKKVPTVVAKYKDKAIQINDGSVIVSALSKLADATLVRQVMDCIRPPGTMTMTVKRSWTFRTSISSCTMMRKSTEQRGYRREEMASLDRRRLGPHPQPQRVQKPWRVSWPPSVV